MKEVTEFHRDGNELFKEVSVFTYGSDIPFQWALGRHTGDTYPSHHVGPRDLILVLCP